MFLMSLCGYDFKLYKIMKKNVLITLFILLSVKGYSQYYGLQMGFKVSMNLVDNNVEGFGKYANFADNGLNLRIGLGPVADFYINEKYAISSGLFYTVKSVGFLVPKSFSSQNLPNIATKDLASEAVFNLQYLQVPLTMKLFTSELFDRSRLFLQFGGLFDLKIAEKALDKTRNPLYLYEQTVSGQPDVFGFGDVNLLIGFGVEHRLSNGEAILVGINYTRGLADISTKTFQDINIKNNLFAIDLGFKF